MKLAIIMTVALFVGVLAAPTPQVDDVVPEEIMANDALSGGLAKVSDAAPEALVEESMLPKGNILMPHKGTLHNVKKYYKTYAGKDTYVKQKGYKGPHKGWKGWEKYQKPEKEKAFKQKQVEKKKKAIFWRKVWTKFCPKYCVQVYPKLKPQKGSMAFLKARKKALKAKKKALEESFSTEADFALEGDMMLEVSDEEGKKGSCKGKVEGFQHGRFTGWKAKFSVGAYNIQKFRAHGARNDDASSMIVPRGCKATAYEHGRFNGWKVTVGAGRHDLNSLRRKGFKNDKMSSIKVTNAKKGGKKKKKGGKKGKKKGAFRGCFKDGHKRDLPVRKKNGSAASCKKQCKGFRYFGRQYNQECWCGNRFGKYGKTSGCKCSGKNIGAWKNCVYSTGKAGKAKKYKKYRGKKIKKGGKKHRKGGKYKGKFKGKFKGKKYRKGGKKYRKGGKGGKAWKGGKKNAKFWAKVWKDAPFNCKCTKNGGKVVFGGKGGKGGKGRKGGNHRFKGGKYKGKFKGKFKGKKGRKNKGKKGRKNKGKKGRKNKGKNKGKKG